MSTNEIKNTKKNLSSKIDKMLHKEFKKNKDDKQDSLQEEKRDLLLKRTKSSHNKEMIKKTIKERDVSQEINSSSDTDYEEIDKVVERDASITKKTKKQKEKFKLVDLTEKEDKYDGGKKFKKEYDCLYKKFSKDVPMSIRAFLFDSQKIDVPRARRFVERFGIKPKRLLKIMLPDINNREPKLYYYYNISFDKDELENFDDIDEKSVIFKIFNGVYVFCL